MTATSSSVRVAVRVRPLTENEKQHYAIKFIPNNEQQIVLDGDRSFTFDYVYPPAADQNQVYSTCVVPLLNKFLEGYNSTILAYGQTGSGKTYSMGIGLDSVMNSTINEGIVPRFINSLFEGLNANKSPNYSFQVYVSFLELHNEDLVDLLCPSAVKRTGYVSNLTIREDNQGNICWSGVREEVVTSPNELMGYLQKGSIARTTASTDMNNTSSRSHAIFSVILKQQVTISGNSTDDTCSTNLNNLTRSPSDQTLVSDTSSSTPYVKKLTSKFHFVDLAGSERLKRTNAVGDRAKEGISINTGLLALGNVISALGDESRRVSHIPYRDSKLTRLLQDSLGGNSQTLMLACASPSDSNITETLNTLKYANRARNIRNRVIVNQQVGESERLKATITRLKEELRGTDDFLRAVNDEMDSLKSQVGSLHQSLNMTSEELALVKYERDKFSRQLNDNGDHDQSTTDDDSLIREYAKTIESLRLQLLQAPQHNTTTLLQKPLFVDPKNSLLQIDHVDSSATLVASPNNSTQYYETPPPSCSEKLDRKSKKKHSYRFGSKRIKNQRRRSITLLTSNSNSASPKQSKFTNDNKVLHEARKTIERETEFLESAKISIASNNFWNNKEPDVLVGGGPKVLQYRRRTVDSIPPISVASALQTDHLNENKRLLQKLSNMIESKHTVIRQLEKSEKERNDQAQSLNRKIAELLSKKTSATSQFKRELADTRTQYECRIKKQQVELQSLRRKHMQLMSKTDGIRNQNQSIIDQLNRTVEKLTHEKKKLIKRLKLESDRAREKHTESERELVKMKRQETALVSAKKRTERELGQQKAASKRSTEEIVALGGQMKQIAAIIKKVMSNSEKKKTNNNNSAITDKNLLAKAAACANVRGYLVKQSAIRKAGGKFKVTTLQQHVYQKKRLIHRAISLYVRGQSTNKVGEELVQKRDRLIQEQKELLIERQLVIEEENKQNLSINVADPQYMDERIDLITVEIDTLNQQIILLSAEKNITDDNDDNWMDVVDKELQIGILDNTDSQVAYEIAISLIRSLEPEEARLVSESLLEDIVQLKTEQQYNTTSIKHLTSMLNSLQTGLVQMRRVGHIQRNFNPNYLTIPINSPLDSLFIKVLQSPVDIQYGLVLPKTETIC
ncbi:P-loop containing nucleoside triphosphate hydrolase protein [Helicostylum pulchrum]|nr:P-loop containing nucleoside triphosphate hydrolase protein [Helicostylum pulchrum]